MIYERGRLIRLVNDILDDEGVTVSTYGLDAALNAAHERIRDLRLRNDRLVAFYEDDHK